MTRKSRAGVSAGLFKYFDNGICLEYLRSTGENVPTYFHTHTHTHVYTRVCRLTRKTQTLSVNRNYLSERLPFCVANPSSRGVRFLPYVEFDPFNPPE